MAREILHTFIVARFVLGSTRQPGEHEGCHDDERQEQNRKAGGGQAGEFAEPAEFPSHIRLGGGELLGRLPDPGHFALKAF